jgi:hypothetical protein
MELQRDKADACGCGCILIFLMTATEEAEYSFSIFHSFFFLERIFEVLAPNSSSCSRVSRCVAVAVRQSPLQES